MSAVSQTGKLLFNTYGFVNSNGDSIDSLAKTSTLWSLAGRIKKGLTFVGHCTSSSGTYASFLRHIPGQLAPFIELIGKCPGKLAGPLRAVNGYVGLSDLVEIFNDAQYFLNGDFINDYLQKEYSGIVAHFALVPTNMMTIVWYCRETGIASFEFLGKAATTIGNARLFTWAPTAAKHIHQLPLIRSVPNLVGRAEWLSQCKVLGFVGNMALGLACYSTLCLAYAFFSLQMYKNMRKCQSEVSEAKERIAELKGQRAEKKEKYEAAKEALEARPTKRATRLAEAKDEFDNSDKGFKANYKMLKLYSELSLKIKCKKRERAALDKNDETQKQEIANLNGFILDLKILRDKLAGDTPTFGEERIREGKQFKIHAKHNLSVAKWDLAATVSKLVINGAILGGTVVTVPVSATVSIPAMAALGTFAMVCVGRSMYLNWNYKAPSIQQVN